MSEAISPSFFLFSSFLFDGEMVEWTLVIFAISPCDVEMVDWLKKISIVVLFGITIFLFHFYNDSSDCLSKLLNGQWCIVKIIVVNLSLQHIRIVFTSWGSHSRSFIRHVKSVQNLSSTFKYVKISRHIICNWIFLILFLIICAFFFFITHSFSDSSVEHSLTMMPFNSSSSVEQLCNKVSLSSNCFNLLFYVEKMCRVGICFVAVVSILAG